MTAPSTHDLMVRAAFDPGPDLAWRAESMAMAADSPSEPWKDAVTLLADGASVVRFVGAHRVNDVAAATQPS